MRPTYSVWVTTDEPAPVYVRVHNLGPERNRGRAVDAAKACLLVINRCRSARVVDGAGQIVAEFFAQDGPEKSTAAGALDSNRL